METKNNSAIFRYLMNLVENDRQENQCKEEPQDVSILLKQELDSEEHVSGEEDDLDDILEENILTEKIKELNVANSDDENDINDLIGLPKTEKVDCSEELELVSSTLQHNRRLKQMLQKVECKLLATKKQLMSEEENMTHFIPTTKIDFGVDFYTNYLSPYFRDGLFSCPPNREQIAKSRVKPMLYGEHGLCTKWDVTEIDALSTAVKDTIIGAYVERVEDKTISKKEKNRFMSKINFIRNNTIEKVCKQIDVGSLDWEVISARMPRPHSTRDCRVLWNLYLNPSINKRKWRKEEIQALLKVAREFHCQNWDGIAKQLNNGRTGYQCFVQYQRSISNKEYTWTSDEFSFLKQIVLASRVNDKDINWSKVLFYFDSCSFDKLYCKWYKTMCPSGQEARKGKFNFNEDKCILQAIKMDGLKLRDIPKILPYRNAVQIRERYMNNLSQASKKYGAWTAEEDCLLKNLIKQYGVGQWAKIASHIKNRSRTQVRQHYKHIRTAMAKDPNITIENYRQRIGRNKKRCKVRDLVKKIENMKKTGHKGAPIHNYDNQKMSDKYGDNTELIKYFIYQKKILEPRQSIGFTFDKNEEDILKICNLLGLQLPKTSSCVAPENKFWKEYAYEAIKFIRKNKNIMRNFHSFCKSLHSSLCLLPPNIVNVHSLRNLMLRLEEEKHNYEAPSEEFNEVKGPSFNDNVDKWMKRLYIMFAIPFLLTNFKSDEYVLVAKKKGYSL